MNIYSSLTPVFISPFLSAGRVGESSLLISVVSPLEDCSGVSSNTSADKKLMGLTLIEKNNLLTDVQQFIRINQPSWLNDLVLSYECLLLEYNDQYINHYQVLQYLQSLLKANTKAPKANASAKKNNALKTHVVSVCYNSTRGPDDRERVLAHTGLSLSSLIRVHSQNPYRIFAVGFMPNFAYLGELEESLHIPRLANPRLNVPAGAVAIADNQTAIYPSKSPGGWHIIGYTPIDLINHPDFVFEAGQQVKFEAISIVEFNEYVSPPKKQALKNA